MMKNGLLKEYLYCSQMKINIFFRNKGSNFSNGKFILGTILFGVFFAAIFSIIPVHKTNVTIDLKCNYIVLKLDKDTTIDEIRSTEYLNIQDIPTLFSPPLNIMLKDRKRDGEFKVYGNDIWFKELKLLKNSELRIEATHNILWLTFIQDQFSGLITFVDSIKCIIKNYSDNNPDTLFKYSKLPETIIFEGDSLGKKPTRLRLNSVKDFTLINLPISSIDFMKVQNTSDFFNSSIGEGSIRLHDINSNIELFENYYLRINVAESKRMSIYKDSQYGLRIKFIGSVTKLRAGPEGFEENLKPNILQKCYYNEGLRILFRLITAFIALILAIMQLTASKNR